MPGAHDKHLQLLENGLSLVRSQAVEIARLTEQLATERELTKHAEFEKSLARDRRDEAQADRDHAIELRDIADTERDIALRERDEARAAVRVMRTSLNMMHEQFDNLALIPRVLWLDPEDVDEPKEPCAVVIWLPHFELFRVAEGNGTGWWLSSDMSWSWDELMEDAGLVAVIYPPEAQS